LAFPRGAQNSGRPDPAQIFSRGERSPPKVTRKCRIMKTKMRVIRCPGSETENFEYFLKVGGPRRTDGTSQANDSAGRKPSVTGPIETVGGQRITAKVDRTNRTNRTSGLGGPVRRCEAKAWEKSKKSGCQTRSNQSTNFRGWRGGISSKSHWHRV